MKNFIGRLLNWLKFWDADRDLGWIPNAKDGIEDDEVIFDASQEEPDRELYDDSYPWSRR